MFDDNAAVGEIDMIGNFARKSHFMGNQDAGHAVLCEVFNGK